MKFQLEALGSLLTIEIFSSIIKQNRINEIFDTVLSFEKKYSRFIAGNFLDTLNKTGVGKIDREFATLIQTAFQVHKNTSGYFDITLRPILENMGYGIEKEELIEVTGMDNIILEHGSISLKNGAQIDMGGLGKGYIIDKISAQLSIDYSDFIVNFGGDIKVAGKKKIGLEDPLQKEKILGEILLKDSAFCASSGEKRKFGDKHHLINPKTLKNSSEVLCSFTQHKLALFADMYATVLCVAPIQDGIETLNHTPGLEAMIILKNGEIYKTQGFDVKLYL